MGWRKGGTGEKASPLENFLLASTVTAANFYCSLHGYGRYPFVDLRRCFMPP